MVKHIVAIDVEARIANFARRLEEHVNAGLTLLDNAAGLCAVHNPLDVEALLTSIYQPIDESELKRFVNLRYIGVLGTSTKKLPLVYCAQHQITVSNITEYCDEDTAEWVVMRMLEFFRTPSSPRSAAHKTIGVVGVGAVGKHILHIAHALGMHVAFNATHEHNDLVKRGMKPMTKDDLFRSCDVISVHTPAFLSWLTADMLRHARRDLCIINTCMGRISVGNDLEQILIERPDITLIMDKIAGDNYPELKQRARLHPEYAFLTADSTERLISKFFANIAQFVATY